MAKTWSRLPAKARQQLSDERLIRVLINTCVSEKSLFLLVGKKCFSECARARRELTIITNIMN
jgi:hypothetical protein